MTDFLIIASGHGGLVIVFLLGMDTNPINGEKITPPIKRFFIHLGKTFPVLRKWWEGDYA